LERAKPPDYEWAAYKSSDTVAQQVNQWSEQAGIHDYEVASTGSNWSPVETLPDGSRQRTFTTACVVKYLPPEGLTEAGSEHVEEVISNVTEPPLPILPQAKAPTVEVQMIQGGRRCKAFAMAGIFGVPEGMKLHPDDEKPAPVPLFSPDFDLKTVKDYFGNIGD
jgi:hypothetical protein